MYGEQLWEEYTMNIIQSFWLVYINYTLTVYKLKVFYIPVVQSRLTIVSCEAKKKQVVCNKQVSYLHVASSLKFVNPSP